jgi:hypothetical protein
MKDLNLILLDESEDEKKEQIFLNEDQEHQFNELYRKRQLEKLKE